MEENDQQHDIEERKAILNDIKKYGCHLVLIDEDNYLPGFVYSIGLYKNYGHPEIICFGLKPDVMASIINDACDLIKNGTTLVTEKLYAALVENYNVQFIEVKKEFYRNYLGYATWFYGNGFDLPVLQLIWPDKQSKFPWEKDFNPDWKYKQPLLDRNTDFKFYEERNLGVYTTKQAFDGQPILYVNHNIDGDWQFHTSLTPQLSDAMLVCLEEITKLDQSINDIYHLQYGWRAWRSGPNEEWEWEERTDEK